MIIAQAAARRHRVQHFYFPLISITLLCLVGGCTTVETQSFQVQRGGNVESAQIATDADFSKYNRLMADDMGIFFPQNVSIPDQDVRRIRAIFRSAFIAELEGYDISREPGPDAMKVQASLIDLRQSGGAIPPMRRDIAEIATPGKLVFLMEMRDSETDRILARAGDSASAPVFATGAGNETA